MILNFLTLALINEGTCKEASKCLDGCALWMVEVMNACSWCSRIAIVVVHQNNNNNKEHVAVINKRGGAERDLMRKNLAQSV